MENKSHALAAGVFVLLVTALLLGLAAWLSRDTQQRDVYEISTRESVSGLSPQAAVRYRGIAIGRVDTIEFDPQVKGNVLVRLAIDQGAPITHSTFATLGFQGVTGLAFVQLDDKGQSTQTLVTSADQPARIPLQPNILMRLSDQGADILNQASVTTQRVNALLSPDNQKAFSALLQSASNSADKIGMAAERLQAIANAQLGPERTDIPALVADTRATMRNLQATTAELNKTAQATTLAMGSATQAVSSVASTVNSLGERVMNKDGVLDQISQGTAALAQSAQNLNANTLPRTNKAVDDLSKTSRTVGRVFNQLADNPQSLVYGNGKAAPGPGEPGFVPPATAP
jgi:phospholipid/cholesterol/gamma-HCH transport system substrate-binding protein